MSVLRVTHPEPRLSLFGAVRDPELAVRHGLFIAEGRLVVERLIQLMPHAVVSLLVTETARRALETQLAVLDPSIPVYVAPQALFEQLTGFQIHRGCLALAQRPPRSALGDLPPTARTLVALDSLTDADNVGSIFRTAWALGGDAVVLGPTTCDPLYRKAIRTSMAATLAVPFFRVDAWANALSHLKAQGFQLVALSPHASRLTIDAFADQTAPHQKLVLMLGAEGTGLSDESLTRADVHVRIPVRPGVDSLNVAVASGIALARLGRVACEGLP